MAAKELYTTTLFNDANLVSYWRLEGNSTDNKGSNNGTDTNITYGTDYGKFSQGASFNGSNSIIDCGTNVSINFLGAFSLSAWIKIDTSSAIKYNVIMSKSKSGSNYEQYVLYENNGTIALRFRNTSDSVFEATKPSAGTGVWQHVVAVFTNNKLKVYVNASAGSETTFTGTRAEVASSLKIGGVYMSNNIGYFDGSIDDVAVFNDGLTADEISGLYNGTLNSRFNSNFFNFF